MSDPRITPNPARQGMSRPAGVVVPVADLCRTPDGPRDRQLLFGDRITCLSEQEGWTYIQSAKDSYCGFVQTSALGPAADASHRVTAPATHGYLRADIKSPDQISLSFGSRIAVTDIQGTFARTAAGFIPLTHLGPVDDRASDPAAIAALFLGTPYLWGGNSRWGIDCSGLVQAAMLACGISCPADSDMQQAIGHAADPGSYRRNDLLFWKGHVALVTDAETMIHANAHAMAVTSEPISDAIARIAASDGGQLVAHRRITAAQRG